MQETTAEYPVEAFVSSAELRVRPRVTVGAKTDLGRVRENNEDKYEFYITTDDRQAASKGHVFVVCDGMGGHEAGQIASELATKTFLDVYLGYPGENTDEALRCAVAAANRFVLDVSRAVPSRRGMGTTLTALVMLQDTGFYAHVGDSRLYIYRNGSLDRLTRDHTWVEEMVAGGAMSREDAEVHPNRHMLLRAIGTDADWQPDVLSFPIKDSDSFLVCSDGLTNHVPDDEIAQILHQCGPSESAWKLVSKALAGGGSDNATALVVRLDRLEEVI